MGRFHAQFAFATFSWLNFFLILQFINQFQPFEWHILLQACGGAASRNDLGESHQNQEMVNWLMKLNMHGCIAHTEYQAGNIVE